VRAARFEQQFGARLDALRAGASALQAACSEARRPSTARPPPHRTGLRACPPRAARAARACQQHIRRAFPSIAMSVGEWQVGQSISTRHASGPAHCLKTGSAWPRAPEPRAGAGTALRGAAARAARGARGRQLSQRRQPRGRRRRLPGRRAPQAARRALHARAVRRAPGVME